MCINWVHHNFYKVKDIAHNEHTTPLIFAETPARTLGTNTEIKWALITRLQETLGILSSRE